MCLNALVVYRCKGSTGALARARSSCGCSDGSTPPTLPLAEGVRVEEPGEATTAKRRMGARTEVAR